jgi:hypothetical protein
LRHKLGPHYRLIAELPGRHEITIDSPGCDAVVDKLIPTWLESGVNTVPPIEVGTWNASIAPGRERFGQDVRGVWGVDTRSSGKETAPPLMRGSRDRSCWLPWGDIFPVWITASLWTPHGISAVTTVSAWGRSSARRGDWRSVGRTQCGIKSAQPPAGCQGHRTGDENAGKKRNRQSRGGGRAM